MSDFGGQWPKPTWTYSGHPYVTDLLRFRVANTKGSVQDGGPRLSSNVAKDGVVKVSGNKENLWVSQNLP
eukprot:6808793-Alexandrium_andersonii.AAC.1